MKLPLVLSAASVAAVTAQRPLEPYMGISELASPEVAGSRASLDVTKHFGGDRRFHLSYEVEHASDAFRMNLDQLDGVDSVDCTASSLAVSFETAEQAEAFVGDMQDQIEQQGWDNVLVSGSPHWGCVKREVLRDAQRRKQFSTPNGVILRKGDADTVQVEGNVVTLETEDAEYHDMFKEAKVRFMTSAFPDDGFTAHNHAAASEEADDEALADHTRALLMGGESEKEVEFQRRSLLTRRGDSDGDARRQLKWKVFKAVKSAWKSVTKAVTKTVKTVVKDVESVGKDVEEIVEDGVELLLTGDLTVDPDPITLAQVSWNYANGAAKDYSIDIMTDVTCNDCYAHAELDLLFELDVSDYKVSYFKVAAEGSFKSALSTTMSASTTKSWDYSKTITTLTMAPITFYIGDVPISIDLSAPINIGVNATLQADAIVSASASASGEVTYGIQYQNGKFSWINDKSFSATGGLNQMSAKATGFVTLFVEPVIELNIEHIGGPTFTLHPHLDITAVGYVNEDILEVLGIDVSSISDFGASPDECTDGVSVSLTAGFDAYIGAAIDIKILKLKVFSYTYPSTLVYTHSKPITSGCWNVGSGRMLRSGRRRADDQGLIDIYDSVESGALFSGEGEEDTFTSKCKDLYGGSPTAYMHMNLRVQDASHNIDDAGTDVFEVVSTINYADLGSATATPFSCIVQNRLIMEVVDDEFAVLVPADDQLDLNFTSCTQDFNPVLEFACSRSSDGGTLQCADTSNCVNVMLAKTMDAEPVSAGKNVASKCYYLTDATSCTTTAGCGWCSMDADNAGCLESPDPNDSLPTTTYDGKELTNCDAGWKD